MPENWVATESERPYHEVSNLFPLMEGTEFEDLKADIAQNGLLEAIWLHPDGSIIDGRNRHRACLETGIKLGFRTWNGQGSLVSFVVSMNLHRRHLTYDQRVGIALKLEPAFAEEARKRQGARTDLAANSQQSFARAAEQAAKQVDVGARAVYEMKAAQREDPDLADKLITGETTVREERKKRKRKERTEKINEIAQGNHDLGVDRQYPVIYADPPWQYEHCKTDNRAIENHYPTMTLKDICAFPVSDLATSDAVLFLWSTSPKLAEAMQVIESWGFVYRTCMVWVKDKIGMGYYARQEHELLLIATRGSLPVPEPQNRPPSVIKAPRLAHSEKPVEFYEAIERMYPEYDKYELFGRKPRKGWAVFGNEVEVNGGDGNDRS